MKQQAEPWVIFLLLSVVAHAAVLITWAGRMGVQDAPLEDVMASHALNIQLLKQQVMEQLPVEVPPEPKPMTAPEKKIIEEIKPAEKPVKDTVVEPEKVVEQVQQVMEPQVQGEQLQHDNQLQIKQKQQYVQALMKHIDAHKFYPSAARRRGIQGEVQVSFCLTADKLAINIEANGSISVLQRAAIQAVQDASPFPEPPAEVFYNSPIVISMVYALE
ncbi:MAG: TonB family protein [Gammaproteobacteria bacterium]|nr:TonB family protein [Gammaproteobacteria bacterium]